MHEYEEASELDPASGIAQRHISRILAQNDDHGEAMKRLRDALKHNPQQVEPMMLADLLERSGDKAAAKVELQRVLDAQPDKWPAAYRLGQLHLRDGELDAVRSVFERAIRAAPDEVPPRLALAAALKEMGEHQGALAVLKEVQKLPSPPSSASMMMADCHEQLGQHEEALTALRQALRRSRRPGVVHRRIADVLTTLGKYAEAVEEYRATVLAQPQLAEKHPELVALIEKAQAPGADLEQLAKQAQTVMASIAAMRRAERGGESPLDDENVDMPAGRRNRLRRPFGRLQN